MFNNAAKPDHPINELLVQRWSPYAFSEKEVSESDILSILEAARWAASSYNEQPWSFIVAMKKDTIAFQEALSCIVEANQGWAQHASVLIFSVVHKLFSKNNTVNHAAYHDVGLAIGNFSVEATARGISLHQMAGIFSEKANALYKIPENHTVFTGIALGYAAESNEKTERTRKAQENFVFKGQWGEKFCK